MCGFVTDRSFFHFSFLLYYNLGFADLIGLSNALTPRVFNFLRNTLSPAETYNISKSFPPKQTFEAWPFDGGIGSIASTLPN
jgi:hypothetical protein